MLLLLFSVCPLSLDCESNLQEKESDNMCFKQDKQAECIDGSNLFPEGDRGCLNANLNRRCDGRDCHILAFNPYSGFTPGTPVFTHYTSARWRYAPMI